MSYEVYINVEHHPRHNDDAARRRSTALRLADEDGALTAAFDRGDDGPINVAIATVLRGMAEDLSPDERELEARVLAPIVLRDVVRLIDEGKPQVAKNTALAFVRALERDADA